MKRLIALLVAPALFALTGLTAIAQTARPSGPTATLVQARTSPHDTINLRINGGRVILVYGRPFTTKPKTDTARTVWGGELVPTGKIWRLGADEATLLITPKPLSIGSSDQVTIPAGTYSLFLYPESLDKVMLVISKQIGEWGLDYDAKQDLGRVLMTKSTLATPIHQFQMDLAKAPGGGVLKLMWEDTQFSVPFTVGK